MVLLLRMMIDDSSDDTCLGRNGNINSQNKTKQS